MATVREWLTLAATNRASDLHLSAGSPPAVRIRGQLTFLGNEPLLPDDTGEMAKELLPESLEEHFHKNRDADFSLSIPGVGRVRVNLFVQRSSIALAIRLIPLQIPSLEDLGLPPVVRSLAGERLHGLIIVTGPAGSGKSTTLAALVDFWNRTQSLHVITLEDPIEYLHKNRLSLIVQREVGSDTPSFQQGLRSAMREDPDVILVGEMRDWETISIALTAAETGHLILSTLHTPDAAGTINRIVDVFPPNQQQQSKVQLAGVLRSVVAQRLLPRVDREGMVLAAEVILNTQAMRNLIREGKSHQLPSVIQMSRPLGMVTMENAIRDLHQRSLISDKTLKRELGVLKDE